MNIIILKLPQKEVTTIPRRLGPLRGCVRGGCHRSLTVFPRAQALERPVRMVLIVVPAKRVDLLPRVFEGHEPMDVQTLFAEAPIERFNRRVVGRLAPPT
jgi:hypothetical protein